MADMPIFDALPDEKKLIIVRELIAAMPDNFKRLVLEELDPVRDEDQKLAMTVTSNEHVVRVDLDKRVRWFALPKEHAIRLAMMLLEHAGATLEGAL